MSSTLLHSQWLTISTGAAFSGRTDKEKVSNSFVELSFSSVEKVIIRTPMPASAEPTVVTS